RRFRALRQNDPAPVAALHAEAGERIREAVRPLLQIPEGVRLAGPGLILPIQGEAGAVSRMPAAAGRADVESSRHLPFETIVDLAIAVLHSGRSYWSCLSRCSTKARRSGARFPADLARVKASSASLGRPAAWNEIPRPSHQTPADGAWPSAI